MSMKQKPKERVLKSRRRKKASKGHVIRVSDLVLAHLDKQRLNHRRQSYDEYLRNYLGLPLREHEAAWIKAGRPPLLVEVFIDGAIAPGERGGSFYIEEKDANGAMVEMYAKKITTRIVKPIRVREVR